MISASEWREFLKWEFQTAGRAPLLWFSSANALGTAADTAYGRYTHCRRTWESSFPSQSPDGLPIASGRALTPDEVNSLGDAGQGGVALMLLGFAIENICKAILVGRNSSLVDGDAGLNESLQTHDLKELATKCGQPLDTDEAQVLELLSEFSIWAGRYPIPLRAVPRDPARPGQGYWVRQRMGPIPAIWEKARPILDSLVSIAAQEG